MKSLCLNLVKSFVYAYTIHCCVHAVVACMSVDMDCDLPYSGRRSCRIEHVLTLERFNLREVSIIIQLRKLTTKSVKLVI